MDAENEAPEHDTGLFKKCPRCGRLGKVVRDFTTANCFTIYWEPTARLAECQDAAVQLDQLFWPRSGCGHC